MSSLQGHNVMQGPQVRFNKHISTSQQARPQEQQAGTNPDGICTVVTGSSTLMAQVMPEKTRQLSSEHDPLAKGIFLLDSSHTKLLNLTGLVVRST